MIKLAMWFLVIGIATLLGMVQAGGHGHGHKHVIIHVPYKIKTIHHTHTITKHVHHKDDGDKYEVLGYTVGHPIDLGGHGHDHIGGGSGGDDFMGGHEFGAQQHYGSIGWSEGFKGQGVEGGHYEGSYDGGSISGHELQGGGHSGIGEHEFSHGGYGGHEGHEGYSSH